MAKYVLAIGADTAQAAPGDALEFTASAGAASFLIGNKKVLAKVLATTSYTTDTPDFWRRPKEAFPQHAGRFTGEPAYFKHVQKATQQLLEEVNLTPPDIDYCIFHTPNGKFPRLAAATLGFTSQQLASSLIVDKIGNTYAAATPLALAAVLDIAQANQKILLTSYGSGSGSDSFLLETTQELVDQRSYWQQFLSDQIEKLSLIDYQTYQNNININHQ